MREKDNIYKIFKTKPKRMKKIINFIKKYLIGIPEIKNRYKYDKLENSPYFSEKHNYYFLFENEKSKIKFDKNVDKYVKNKQKIKKYKIKEDILILTIIYNYYRKIQRKRYLIIDKKTGEKFTKQYDLR